MNLVILFWKEILKNKQKQLKINEKNRLMSSVISNQLKTRNLMIMKKLSKCKEVFEELSNKRMSEIQDISETN